MSESLGPLASESLERPPSESLQPPPSGHLGSDSHGALRVQATFHIEDERQAQVIAASMIDHAYEIANVPECQCDVDVSVERMTTTGGEDAHAPQSAGQ